MIRFCTWRSAQAARDQRLALLDRRDGRRRAVHRVEGHAQRASCDQALVAGEACVLDDFRNRLARLAQVACNLLDHGDEAPGLAHFGMCFLLLQQRNDGGRQLQSRVAPAAGLAAVQAYEHAGQQRRRFDPLVADGLRAGECFVDDGSRLGKLTELQENFAEFRKQAAGGAGSSCGSRAIARRNRLPAACASPRANATTPRRCQAPRAIGADLQALLVQRPQLARGSLCACSRW